MAVEFVRTTTPLLPPSMKPANVRYPARQGKTYEALVIDVIAAPLGFKDTRIAFTTNMKKNLAMGHQNGVQVENWDITTLAGAGAIRSTAVDMLNYVLANMGKVKTKLYPLKHCNVMWVNTN